MRVSSTRRNGFGCRNCMLGPQYNAIQAYLLSGLRLHPNGSNNMPLKLKKLCLWEQKMRMSHFCDIEMGDSTEHGIHWSTYNPWWFWQMSSTTTSLTVVTLKETSLIVENTWIQTTTIVQTKPNHLLKTMSLERALLRPARKTSNCEIRWCRSWASWISSASSLLIFSMVSAGGT